MTDPATTQLEIHPDDPDDEWSTGPTRRGLRLQPATAVLLGLIVLAGGFWGGAIAEKHHGSSSSTSSAFSALASRLGASRAALGGTGGTGAGAGGTGGARAATAGIVTGVQGNVLYVTDATGGLIKVVVPPSASITRTAKSSLAGLQTGDTVVVQGTTAAGGTVTATSVRGTGQGVSVTGGLGGALGNPGG